MSLTRAYTTIHKACQQVGASEGLAAWSVRVLLACYEAGRPLQVDALGKLLGTDGSTEQGSQVRRCLGELYKRGLLDGYPRKRGTMTTVRLTIPGYTVAQRAAQLCDGALQ